MTEEEKFCTICIDGMALTPGLRYDCHSDRVVGFEDCGSKVGGRTSKIGNEFVAVWLKGVSSKWKQPIGHYLVHHSPGESRFSQILTECLAATKRMGLSVCAIVCDQEPTQWKSLKKLRCNSDQSAVNLKLSDESQVEVPVLIDVPHCIKNMRNALQKYAIEFDYNGKRMFASWRDILVVAGLELAKPDQLRLVPKLRECHVNLTIGKKMSVKLAAQVLSRTMAHAIAVYSEYGLLSTPTALGTAKFCELINTLFDLTNNAAVFNSITTENIHIKSEEIDSWIAWLSSLRFVKDDGRQFNGLSFHEGWQWSLKSLKAISKKLLHNAGCKSILSRSFTQDYSKLQI
ncbi:MAG: hypothetical protein V2I33_16575 [Kangiellaceae bacterium]|nr:hypothetical protein [Kangiellaceae bacterium]